jgi:hypothetical protein
VKVIIAGSRTINVYFYAEEAIRDSGFAITEVVCGMARGVDMLGYRWAKKHGIPIKEFPADWERLGKAAGRARNWEMARYAEALIAMTNGSSGTRHMIETARTQGLKVFVKEVKL